MSDDLIDILNDYRAWQSEQAELLEDRWKGGERIVTRLDGAPICPDTLSGWFYTFIQKNDLPQISIHSLRHTNTTNSHISKTNYNNNFPCNNTKRITCFHKLYALYLWCYYVT